MAFGSMGYRFLKASNPRAPDSLAAQARVTVDASGRVLVVGNDGWNADILAFAFDAVGNPSGGFGAEGQVTLARNGVQNATDFYVGADGKWLIVGGDGAGNFLITRLLPDGRVDQGFALDGWKLKHFEGDQIANAVVPLPDGGFVVAGSSAQARLAMARYDVQGNLVSSFGDGGRLFDDRYHPTSTGSLALDPQRNLVLALRAVEDGSLHLLKLDARGAAVVLAGARGEDSLALPYAAQSVLGVGLLSDGAMIVAFVEAANPQGVSILKLSRDGLPDTSFGTGGMVRLLPDLRGELAGVLQVAADGSLLVALGSASAADGNLVVHALTASGAPKVGFGRFGAVELDFGGAERPNAIALQPDGKLVIAATRHYTKDGASQSDIVVARLRVDGSLDANAASASTSTTATVNEDSLVWGSLPKAADRNGDPLTYAKVEGPRNGHATVDADGRYVYVPRENFNGSDVFTYSVSDGKGGVNLYVQSFLVNPVNDPPTGRLTVSGTAAEGQTLLVSSTVADADGIPSFGAAALRLQWQADGADIRGATGASLKLTQAMVGKVITVTARYTDNAGQREALTSTPTAPVASVNDAPTVAKPLSDTFVAVGSRLDFGVPSDAFVDIDSTLSYSATHTTGTALPVWLSFDPNTRTLSGTPAAADVGAWPVRITASDGALSVSDELVITVVSDAPAAVQFNPMDGAWAVPVNSDLVLSFSEPIQLGPGPLQLKTAAGTVVEVFNATTARVSGSTLTLNPTGDLRPFTHYVVDMGPGAVRDLAGNLSAASSRYDFQTATPDSLYLLFLATFGAAPGASYMRLMVEALGSGLGPQQITEALTMTPQFQSLYPATGGPGLLASQLIENIVKDSASNSVKAAVAAAIETVLSPAVGWSLGKAIHTVLGSLTALTRDHSVWGATVAQLQNKLTVARYFTEDLGLSSESLSTLRGAVAAVTADSDVSTPAKIIEIIGSVPPGG